MGGEEGLLLPGEELSWEQGSWWALPRLSPALTCSPSPLQDRDSTEEDTTKPLMPLEMSPELAKAVAEETEAGEELEPRAAEPEELGEPQEEGGMELEVEQVGSELEEEEEEEELGTEEQEEDQEPCEEPNDLGDPAVMRAVQSKPTLEVTRQWGGRGPTPVGPAPLRAPGSGLVPA